MRAQTLGNPRDLSDPETRRCGLAPSAEPSSGVFHSNVSFCCAEEVRSTVSSPLGSFADEWPTPRRTDSTGFYPIPLGHCKLDWR